MPKSRPLFRLILILALLCPAPALAASPAAPAAGQELVIVCEDYPPYQFLDQGQPAGQDIELVQEACQRLGIRPRFVFTTWAQALADVREGRAMAVMSISRTAERDRYLVFPRETLSHERIVAMARRESEVRLRRLDDLARHRVGVNPDFDYGPALADLAGITKVEAKDTEALLRDLAAGRSELALGNELTLEFVARRLGLYHDLVRVRTLASLPLYIAFARHLGPRAQELAAGFDRTLKAMTDDGTASIIRGQY
ncbi:MAG: transporter substrate-binding domain-containing protein [Pseudomonadota bacterium]